MKDTNGHTHWQFGDFSPNKEHRFIYEVGVTGDKPPEAAEAQKLQETMDEITSLEQVASASRGKLEAASKKSLQLTKTIQRMEQMWEEAGGKITGPDAAKHQKKVAGKTHEEIKEIMEAKKAELEAAKIEEQQLLQEYQEAKADISTALGKLSPDQQKAFQDLKKANEQAKNSPPGSAEGKNIVMAIIEAILEWIRSANDKDKDKDKDKGAKGAQGPKGPNGPNGPENNNQTPPEKQEAPELKAIRDEIEAGPDDRDKVYDKAVAARDVAETKLDVAKQKLNTEQGTALTLEKDVKTAEDGLKDGSKTQADVDAAKEALRNHKSLMKGTEAEIAHQENEYTTNKAKVDLMDGAKEVAEKEAEEIKKGIDRVAAEIGAPAKNPNEKALDDAISGIVVAYKPDTLDDVQFTTNYTEAEWNKVKAVAKDMGLDPKAFETDNEGVIANPERFASELGALAKNMDAGAEADASGEKELTDAGVDESIAEGAIKIKQKYGVEFKASGGGHLQVEGGESNAKKAALAFRKESELASTINIDAMKALKNHLDTALSDITSGEGKAVLEALAVPSVDKVNDQLVKLAKDPAMPGFKSKFSIDNNGIFSLPPKAEYKDKIINSKLFNDGDLVDSLKQYYA